MKLDTLHMQILLDLGIPRIAILRAGEDDEAIEPEDSTRKVNKIPYLDFAAREAKGESVNRSVLVDAKYDDNKELISGKLMSIPADLDPTKYRLPGRKFWNDETDLLKLKKMLREADLAEIQQSINELNDTIVELSSIGDPAQRQQFASARRALSASMRMLKEAGLDITIEDLVARLNKAKAGA